MTTINQPVLLVRMCIILLATFSLANNLKAQADTLHLNYYYSQTMPHDTTLAQVNTWITSLTNRRVSVNLVAYYSSAEYKKVASTRLEELFLILSRKARSIINIENMTTKHGKALQRSRVDIVYTFADGLPSPEKEKAAMAVKPAPDANNGASAPKTTKQVFTSFLKQLAASQAIKVNLTQLAIGNLSFQYECVLSKKLSVAMGGSYLVPRQVKSYFSAFSDERLGDKEVGFISPVISGWSITPELRFYPFAKENNGARAGFYVAPYMRISNFSMVSAYKEYYDGVTYDLNFTSRFHCVSGGVMIGKQWQVGKRKRVLLDWWIIGLGAGTIAPELQASASNINMSAETQNDVKTEVEKALTGFKFLGFKNPQVSTTNHSFTATMAKIPFVSARGLGFCIGYVF